MSAWIPFILSAAVAGAAALVLVAGVIRRSVKRKAQQAFAYHLPIVMERMVMAVESGLDIVPAVEAIASLSGAEICKDPVTQAFQNICIRVDYGSTFLEAIELEKERHDSPSLQHALVHLGVAAREGGEVIHSLRELSDSVQLQFQEAAEEETARMPVLATMPLLCIFAGLVILFLVAPLIQVVKITGQALPQ